jgi:hypothetical protein
LAIRNKDLKKITIIITGLLLFIGSNCNLHAQVLKDTATLKLMCRGVDYIYNLQFDQAREIYKSIVAKYPEHPMIYVYKGLITYWENYPLTPDAPLRATFEKDLLYAIDLCDKIDNTNYEAEYLLSNIGARGLLLLFYADNDLTKDVMSVASGTYQYVKKSFDYTKTYADFYFVTGLYNYYREVYPVAHPVYKPVAMLFPRGNKEKGLKEMQYASKNAIILKAEAFSFLSGIYISFENDFQQAYQYSKALHELYPRNYQYLAVYIKNLLLVKKYNEAEGLLKSTAKGNNAYYQAQLCILNGILQEKKYKNSKTANYFYTKGVKDIAQFGTLGSEFMAYGYYGLSRISLDKHQKKAFRKQAIELAVFENVNFDK